MNCSPRTLVLVGLWIFLISWTYYAMIRKFLDEETIFNHEHDEHENAFQWPVVNICPYILFPENVKTFAQKNEEIEQTKLSFFATMIPKGATPDNLR